MADRFDVACVDVLSDAAFLSDRSSIRVATEYRCVDDRIVARVARKDRASYASAPCYGEDMKSELSVLMDAVCKMDCAHQHPCDDWGAFSD